MSTLIDVSVDLGGLLQRSRQQIRANRQSRLEADSREVAAVEGKRQRTAQQVVNGLDANGNPIGISRAINRLEQEPAAFRYGKKVLFAPLYQPFIETQTFPELTLRTKYFLIDDTARKGAGTGSGSVQPNRWYYRAIDYENSVAAGGATAVTSLVSEGGPSGANALVVQGNGQSVDIVAGNAAAVSGAVGFSGTAVTYEGFIKQSGLANGFQLHTGALIFYVDAANSYLTRANQETLETQTIPIGITTADFADWSHFAVVFAQQAYKIFLNGQQVLTFPTELPVDAVELSRLFFIDPGTSSAFLAVSSLRVQNRALYRNTFTPPTAIN